LKNLINKVEGTLIPAIEEHTGSDEFSAEKDGLDFLGVKNSMMLSYLIDLVHRCSGPGTGNIERLIEMRTALEKIRPLEKKMRYQLDKLLTLNTSSAFVTAGEQQDPLSYAPDLDALKEDNVEKSLSSDDEDDSDESDNDQDRDDNIDDDLEAARATLKLAQEQQQGKNSDRDDFYRAPRLASVPYPSNSDRDKQKRLQQKLRATELARTLREQFGDAPEQEDLHGGSDYGRQRDAARRLAEQEREKTEFEEDNLVRLVTSRNQKKEKKRLMRQEGSNLAAIADIGNIARSVSAAFGEKSSFKGRDVPVDFEDSGQGKKKRRRQEAKNSLQKALYGTEGDGKKKKKR
jgi:hypothetical protein